MENLIIQILSKIIESAFITYFFTSIFKDLKISKSSLVLTFICSFITSTFTNVINLKHYSPIINTIFFVIVLILILKLIIKATLLKSILTVFLYYIFIAICEIISYYILTSMLNIQIDINSFSLLLLISLQHIIAIALLLLFHTFTTKKYNFSNLTFKNTKILLFMIVGYMLPQIILFTIAQYSYPLPLMLISTLQIFLVSVLIFNYMRKIIKEEKAELELKNYEIHNKALIETVDGIKKLKHDYGNIVQALNGYVVTKNYDKMHEYVNSLIREFSDINSVSLMDPKIFNEPAIYGVVGAKYFSASEENIPFEIEITSNIKDINFSKPELSRIFGILLDNAIEAVKKVDNKYIKLEIHHNNIKGADVIKIINSFDTTNQPNLDTIYEKGVSSKKIKSGIGLWEVKKIINKAKNSQIYATIEGDKFVQNLIIEE